MRLTPEQKAAIRERLEAATPGPWEVIPDIRPDVVTAYVWTEHKTGGYCDSGQITTNRRGGSTSTGGKHIVECAKNFGTGNIVPGSALADADFIAHAPTDLRALLDENDALQAEVAALRARMAGMQGMLKSEGL